MLAEANQTPASETSPAIGIVSLAHDHVLTARAGRGGVNTCEEITCGRHVLHIHLQIADGEILSRCSKGRSGPRSRACSLHSRLSVR